MSKNFFWYEEHSDYSYGSDTYGPEENYPEYPFALGYFSPPNDVYRMVRNILLRIGDDQNNYGKQHWNPLKNTIHAGDTVLIKPNWVNHQNPEETDVKMGMECLITHPAVVRVIFDYVYLALQGRGKIIIADAPVQSCNFEKMIKNGGYEKLFAFLKSLSTDSLSIIVADLRDICMEIENRRKVQNKVLKKQFGSTVVDLGKDSRFYKCKSKGLRVTDYDGRETESHHRKKKNEYCISDALLEADVVISLIKPKSHRIAGYTGALKNFIGISAQKEYLPHHRKGCKAKGGDEYTSGHGMIKWLNSTGNDIKNWGLKAQKIWLSELADNFCRFLGVYLDKKEPNRKKYGMWYGNDTIWRTILDINYIVNYCDKKGEICKNKQRKILYFGDMIVCGEGEGPLHPSYKKIGGIMFSDNPVAFDLCIVKMMGFDYTQIPTLINALKEKKLIREASEKIELDSNHSDFRGKLVFLTKTFQFVPTTGWRNLST